MLSDEQNRRLTQVGAGTPMGELLRRYWMPIAAVAELDDKATKPVRLLGENLVLYRDQGDDYVTRVFDFTPDLGTFKDDLAAQSAGGGAEPRSLPDRRRSVWPPFAMRPARGNGPG